MTRSEYCERIRLAEEKFNDMRYLFVNKYGYGTVSEEDMPGVTKFLMDYHLVSKELDYAYESYRRFLTGDLDAKIT